MNDAAYLKLVDEYRRTREEFVTCPRCEKRMKRKNLMGHKAPCGLTCDPGLGKVNSEHTPIPGTRRRHFSMDDCEHGLPLREGPRLGLRAVGEGGPCPGKPKKDKR